VGGRTLAEASENDFSQFEAGVFAQDKWQVNRKLTISYGLRWDNYNQRQPALDPATTRIGQFLSLPNFPSAGLVPGYHKGFQPRLGIAWDPTGSGKTVIRLNGGVFYSDLPAIIVANGTANNGSIAGTLFSASFLNVPAQEFGLGFLVPPVYPNCATGPATSTGCAPPTVDLFDPQVVLFAKNFPYPRTYEGSAWVERQISNAWKVSAGFNYALSTHQNRNLLFNAPCIDASGNCVTPPGPDGRPTYNGAVGPFSGCSPALPPGLPASPNPNCSGAGIATFSNVIAADGRALYRGFTAKVDRQFAGKFLLSSYYTYSQTYDDGTTERDQFTFQFSDPLNFAPERGPSPQDQRHTFGLYSVLDLPWHFTWSNTVNAHSRRPRSLLCNFDANNDSIADGDRVFTDGQGNYSCGAGGVGRIINVNGQLIPLVASLSNGHDTGRDVARFNDRGVNWNIHVERPITIHDRFSLKPSIDVFNITNNANLLFPACSELQTCFQGTILQVPGDSRRMQFGARFEW